MSEKMVPEHSPCSLCVQTVVLFNGQEVEKWTFASGIFRPT